MRYQTGWALRLYCRSARGIRAAGHRARRLPASLSDLVPRMRELGLHRTDGSVRRGLERTVHWSHVTAALVVFSSDVVKPVAAHAPAWVGIGALAAFLCLLLVRRYWWPASEVVSTAIVFCVTTAVLSALVIGLESRFGGKHGSIAEQIPGIENLQQRAGIVEHKLDTVAQSTNQLLQGQKRQEEGLSFLLQQNKSLFEEMRRAKGVPYAVLSDMLSRVGETVSADDPGQIEKKLSEKLEENAALRRQLAQLKSGDPRVPALRKELSASSRAAQYVIDKWKLDEVHRLSTGEGVVVAVIDSAIDTNHPELAGSVVNQFGDGCGKAHPHGTAMAGAIGAHGRLLGVAPSAKIISICAFVGNAGGQATAREIIKGLDYAISQGARVINLGFGGPRDPILDLALKKVHEQGIALIAPVGNAGPKSPPLYPGAHPHVIAVTATDQDDRLYNGANQGKYIAVAAPGVDILAPAPNNEFQLTTGTTVAAALVSGVVALLIAQKPSRTPDEIRAILMSTAKPLGPSSQFGAGLVEPLKALQQASRT